MHSKGWFMDPYYDESRKSILEDSEMYASWLDTARHTFELLASSTNLKQLNLVALYDDWMTPGDFCSECTLFRDCYNENDVDSVRGWEIVKSFKHAHPEIAWTVVQQTAPTYSPCHPDRNLGLRCERIMRHLELCDVRLADFDIGSDKQEVVQWTMPPKSQTKDNDEVLEDL
jgi:hypothetical protein